MTFEEAIRLLITSRLYRTLLTDFLLKSKNKKQENDHIWAFKEFQTWFFD